MKEIIEDGNVTAYVGVGSNLGDKAVFCRRAVRMVDEMVDCRVCRVSSLYRTEPVGVQGHDWYLNGVIGVCTTLTPQGLLERLLDVEYRLGRVRTGILQPRVIDLDLLLFGRTVINTLDLILPHPRMHLRRFVMAPMAEIAPDLPHPVLGLTVEKLLEACPSDGQGVSLWPSVNSARGKAWWS
ncbi:MAG: 2-amino-4-hydroxy-6-hydroxymethyldihydropteridine diphosphokinase [Desulfatiglandaceae bacterium]